MSNKQYPFLRFHQYESGSPSDDLLMFAAKAKDLYTWAGIPRKGWHIRALFQRPITPAREGELIRFWTRASNPAAGEDFIVGPTAVIIAIQDQAIVQDGRIDLAYKCPVDLTGAAVDVASELATLLRSRVESRLSVEQREVLIERDANPFSPLPEIGSDYVFEFALQLQQIANDSSRFFVENSVDQQGQEEMITSMEAILRPAIVVDGQHRLYGAAHVEKAVTLPVVAIPHCPWTEQIYQFVVINEKAQRVEQSLLTDIFGSSLTNSEQQAIRNKLSRSNVEIESRIAAVVAGRSADSPFENMVIVKMDGGPPTGVRPYISDRTIRVLIDGSSQKYSWGWRTHEDFYNSFVAPTFPNRDEWESWTGGHWQKYWFAFWRTVRDYYNEECRRKGAPPIWSPIELTNLTKGVTLRQIQTLFMTRCVENIKKIESTRDVLIEAFNSVEQADAKIAEQRLARALPANVDDFCELVRTEFLTNGIPLRVFTTPWKASLDDAQGQLELWDTLSTAYERSRKQEQFRVRGRIFEATDE